MAGNAMSAIRVTSMMSHQNPRLKMMGLESKQDQGSRWEQRSTTNTHEDEDC